MIYGQEHSIAIVITSSAGLGGWHERYAASLLPASTFGSAAMAEQEGRGSRLHDTAATTATVDTATSTTAAIIHHRHRR